MYIAFITYPTAHLRSGGLQNQMYETKFALEALGHRVDLFNELVHNLKSYDIIHIFSIAHGNYIWIDECNRQNVPFIVSTVSQSVTSLKDFAAYRLFKITANNIIHNNPLSSLFFKEPNLRNSLNRTKHVIAQTKSEKNTIIKIFKFKEEKITVIPNGVNSIYSFKEGIVKENHIFIPASIYPHKNQLSVLAAARNLNIKVKLAGEIIDKKYFKEIMLFDNVEYLGCIPSGSELMLDQYRQAKVTALTSLGETFGLTLLESLACGTPVVFTNKTAFKEIKANNFIRYVEPQNITQIQNALSHFFFEKINYLDIAPIVNEYSWCKIAKNIELLYSSVIQNHYKSES